MKNLSLLVGERRGSHEWAIVSKSNIAVSFVYFINALFIKPSPDRGYLLPIAAVIRKISRT